MGKNYQYYVEGEDEEKIVKVKNEEAIEIINENTSEENNE